MRNMSRHPLSSRNHAHHCLHNCEGVFEKFWAAPSTGSAQAARLDFGSKLVALVANWAGFADSADS